MCKHKTLQYKDKNNTFIYRNITVIPFSFSLYFLVDIDFLPVKNTENVITDFRLLLPIPIYPPAIPRYFATIFLLAVPSAGIPGIGKYA